MIKFCYFKDEGGRNLGDHGFDFDVEFDDLRKWIGSHRRLSDHRSSNKSAPQCGSYLEMEGQILWKNR